VKAKEPEHYQLEKITDLDLGQMYLIFNQILAVRTSSDITFFKLVYNTDLKRREWVLHLVLNIRGFLYFMRGNVRIQICTDEKIYFYIVDK
jgi:hypothetical protein